ncbi:MAG: Nif3-like dinuclear metal center hexameric protein [Tissierellia bacterium]|nr:Nif3-like dinuclear metal center hexameric protein [Tissierellia bacterium]
MEIKDLLYMLKEKYPLELQEEWDNSGLQFGNINRKLENVMISLDLEIGAIEKAIENNCNLIITHHPYLFNATKRIDLRETYYRKLELCLKNDIALFSMHTNLDIAECGVNDNLCKILDIKDTNVLDSSGLGRVGRVDDISAFEFSKKVKEILEANGVIIYGDREKILKVVSVCGGSGASLFDKAIEKNSDAILTADVKYHEAMDAIEKGLIVIDPGHFASENHIIYKLQEEIERMCDIKTYTFSKTDNFREFI